MGVPVGVDAFVEEGVPPVEEPEEVIVLTEVDEWMIPMLFESDSEHEEVYHAGDTPDEQGWNPGSMGG